MHATRHRHCNLRDLLWGFAMANIGNSVHRDGVRSPKTLRLHASKQDLGRIFAEYLLHGSDFVLGYAASDLAKALCHGWL